MEAILHGEDSMEVAVADRGQSSEESPDCQEACQGGPEIHTEAVRQGSPGGFEQESLMTVKLRALPCAGRADGGREPTGRPWRPRQSENVKVGRDSRKWRGL